MDWGSPEFVIAIVAICSGAAIIKNWIRAKHGYPLEDDNGEKVERTDNAETRRLRDQNQQLRDVMERMEDRMIVLERIVTDKGYSLADEIEALRDRPAPRRTADAGTPLTFKDREEA